MVQCLITTSNVVQLMLVDIAIDFDCQSCAVTIKVHDESSDNLILFAQSGSIKRIE
jgi:hypothetical protein